MQLRVDSDGTLHCVYAEAIDLASLGALTIRRASHVEPDVRGRWWADLSPVGGSQLGPFLTRTLTLEAELAWLETHWLSRPLAPAKQ